MPSRHEHREINKKEKNNGRGYNCFHNLLWLIGLTMQIYKNAKTCTT
jgi:hypothetical protein